MKVFKFGGASVKDATGVKNIINILDIYKNEKLVVVISAMGKTTNTLEKLTDAFFSVNLKEADKYFSISKEYHSAIMDDLFGEMKEEVEMLFAELKKYIEKTPSENFDFEYDQIVCYGELISTRIVAAYLNGRGFDAEWLDARGVIKTDNNYREGKINWTKTCNKIKEKVTPLLTQGKLTITQGFIGSGTDGFTTTLGREGSDYTAAILSHCLEAESVTIWKDVQGVLNADPKWFSNTIRLEKMSYLDAIELAYYGATVIHPKTIQPLQNKKVPLYVKSFLNPDKEGTVINTDDHNLEVPSFIFKINQVLITISPKDFSFIVEENFRDIFDEFSRQKVHINVMQNSALSFTVCVDNNERKLPLLITALKSKFKVKFNTELELITIRHYDDQTIARVCEGKKILLEQKSRTTVQLVVKNED